MPATTNAASIFAGDARCGWRLYLCHLADRSRVANWLDPSGIEDGYGILRWQQIPPDMKSAGLARDLRVLPLAEVASLPGIACITPEQRQRQLALRVTGYNSRTA